MAVAIGLGIGELAVLAAGAAAAVFLTSPPGQRAVQTTAKEISDALSKSDDTVDVAPPIAECTKPCPPCSSPCPDPPPPRTDRVPPSRPHYPCPGDHTHFFNYVQNQDPTTCKCFCNIKEEVICN